MNKNHSLMLSKLSLLTISMLLAPVAFSAEPINLSHKSPNFLKSFSRNSFQSGGIQLQETKRNVDFNQSTHIRFKESFQGHPVWGGEGIVHLGANTQKNQQMFGLLDEKNSSMNGILYQGLEADLKNTPANVFENAQAEKAIEEGIRLYRASGSQRPIDSKHSKLMVYVDKENKAHWAFLVSLNIELKDSQMPEQPKFIMDAITFKVYKHWDDLKTLENAEGGGFGGNLKVGKLVYDGLEGNLSKLAIDRKGMVCSMKNEDVTVRNFKMLGMVSTFQCGQPNKKHNNVYWSGDFDQAKGGYSPSNDAMFDGMMIRNMYRDWYKLPVLEKDGKPMVLTMLVHVPIENAFFNGMLMAFGDGGKMFYPLTSLGVGAHEISHGFTQQHSDLAYEGQSGGLNESFSDMAAQAAEYYAYGKSSWQIGPEIVREENKALRYMDQPSKDCEGKEAGDECSIDHVKDYHDDLNVHFSSGIFNRVFYLIATAKDWNVRKAFDVMVHANMNYWTSSTDFEDAACGVMKSTKDFKYDMTAVTKAFETVGISVDKC